MNAKHVYVQGEVKGGRESWPANILKRPETRSSADRRRDTLSLLTAMCRCTGFVNEHMLPFNTLFPMTVLVWLCNVYYIIYIENIYFKMLLDRVFI